MSFDLEAARAHAASIWTPARPAVPSLDETPRQAREGAA